MFPAHFLSTRQHLLFHSAALPWHPHKGPDGNCANLSPAPCTSALEILHMGTRQAYSLKDRTIGMGELPKNRAWDVPIKKNTGCWGSCGLHAQWPPQKSERLCRRNTCERVYVKGSHLKDRLCAKPPHRYSVQSESLAAKLKDKQGRKKEGGKEGGQDEKEGRGGKDKKGGEKRGEGGKKEGNDWMYQEYEG